MEEKKLYNAVRKTITLADGRRIEIETGKLAKQADGSVVVKMGDTMLLGTVVAAKDAKPDTDFMPLQVEYKEKYASVGRYPGGFMKREGKANDSEVLVARLIDRFQTESRWTKIYVQSILPVNGEAFSKYKGHYAHSHLIVPTNKLLEALCDEKGVTYLDVWGALADHDGRLDKRYTNDGLHLMGEGYVVWRDAIKQHVR